MILSLLGLAGGIGMPMQTSINAQLGRLSGSPFTAAMINFMVGISALLMVTLAVERSLAIPLSNVAEAPLWVVFGGVLAVFFIMANILIMPRLGSVQTAILPALGQILMGTLIDTFGWFESMQKPLGLIRILGVALVFCGVVVIIYAKATKSRTTGWSGGAPFETLTADNLTANPNNQTTANPSNLTAATDVRNIWLWRLFGFAGGMSMAAQTAINSHLSVVVDSKLFASVVNFSVGLSLLIILNILLLKTRKPWDRNEKAPLWIWSGGLFGVLFVIGNIVTARAVGTGMAVVVLLTGLMIGGLLVDQFGLFHSEKRPVTIRSILGVLLMVFGAILFYIF